MHIIALNKFKLGLYKVNLHKIIFVCLTMATATLRAQDPQFSQFYGNPLYVNPAFAGTSTVGRVVVNTRNQWPSISGAFRTVSASYDEHFDAINGGFGVQASYDEQGVGTLRTVSINGMYSYQLAVSKKFTIRPAIQVGLTQKSIDFTKLNWYDQIVVTQGFINPPREYIYLNGTSDLTPTITLVNFAAGVVGYSKNFYAGFAAHNLFEPNQDFFSSVDAGGTNNPKNIIPRRYTGHLGLVVPLIISRNEKKAANLYPNVIFMNQRQFNQLNLGMYANKGPLVAGVYFRQNTVNADAFIVILGIRTPKVKVGYSYDATVSEARPGAVNSHEISLALELKKRIPKRTIRPMRCPDF
jgi:type IX secretion system PorP/SprF family membrane protein